jgi:POT family proton-dependent oligopeptide transporter
MDSSTDDSAVPPHVEKQRIVALAIICAIVMMFWMAFKQNGGTLPLWTRDNTDRAVTIFDLRALLHGHLQPRTWVIPPGVFSSVNSLFIIMLTPPLVMLFGALRKRGREPSTPAKLGIGMVLTAGAYAIMVVASSVGGDAGKVGMGWLIGCYLVITLGELCISPMGLSMVTKLAPRRMTAMLMGLWFGSTAAGNWLAGKSGAWFWERWSHTRFFLLLVVTSLTAALVLRLVLRRLQAAMPSEGSSDGSGDGPHVPPPPSATSPLILTTPGIGSSVG